MDRDSQMLGTKDKTSRWVTMEIMVAGSFSSELCINALKISAAKNIKSDIGTS